MAGGLTSAPAAGSGTYTTMAGPSVGGSSAWVDAPDVVAMGQGHPIGGNSGQTGRAGLDTNVTTSSAELESHLDSFFDDSGWTREDVLVLAAAVQLGMWVALLYLEVTD
jgi:hypothetical protein